MLKIVWDLAPILPSVVRMALLFGNSLANISFDHIHGGIDYLIGVILLMGGGLGIGFVSGKLKLGTVAGRYLLAAISVALVIGGLDQIISEALSPVRDPFSIVEITVVFCLVGMLVLVLPWLSVRFLASRRVIEDLRGGLESSERLATLAAAERELLSLRYIQSAEALKRSVEDAYRFAALVEVSKDAVVGVNQDGTVWHWNQAAEALFKLKASDVLSSHLSAVKAGTSSDLWKETVRLASPPFRQRTDEVMLVCGDGSTVPAWLSVSKLPVNSHGGGYAIIARNITEKKKVEDTISSSLAEKEALLKEVHHRVKNNLQLICSLLRLQSKEASDPQALKLFRKSEDRVRSLALIHDKLYRSESLSSLNFGGYLRDLVSQMVRSATSSGPSVNVAFDVIDLPFPVDTAITCGLIVNELVANSIKHAQAEHPSLRVALRQEGDAITISVWDNGISEVDPSILERPTNLGFSLVVTLTRQLGGSLSVNHNGGTELKVSLPASVLRPKDHPVAGATLAA